jgi:diacylglycerol kinase family enzyme
VALINMIRRLGAALPPIGLLRLGTGNGWARVTGAGALRATLEKLKRNAAARAITTERFNLIDVEGTLAPFAGAGWDARVLNDFQAGCRGREGFRRRLRQSLAGYLWATVMESWPHDLEENRRYGRPRVTVQRFSGEAYRIGKDDALVPLAPSTDVLYSGPVGVTGCATIENFGFGFRAHPFARARRGFMSFRVIDMPVARALGHLPSLWQGTLRDRGIRDFLVQGVRFEFSRPLPFQIGGDAMGERRAIDVHVSDVEVDLVSWRG